MTPTPGETGGEFLDDPGFESAASFDRFYAGTHRRLLAQLTAMIGDSAEAQDCLQEGYMRAWVRWDRVAAYDDPEVWVRTVAWRVAISRWRRVRNASTAWARHGPPPPLVDVAPIDVALLAALQKLPRIQRQAVVLHHLADLGIAEIANETGAREGTVKARLARGRRKLAELLATRREDR